MNNCVKYLLSVLFLLNHPFIHSQSVSVINAGKNVNKNESLNLSSVASDIEYIKLETTDDCLLSGEILQVELSNNEIFLCDGYYIYRFDLSGKFLKRIGKRGQGPGEYSHVVTDFLFNPANQHVTVYDMGGKRFITYDKNGNYVSGFKSNLGGGRMAYLQPDVFVAFDMGFPYSKEKDWYDLIQFNMSGKILKKYPFGKIPERKYGFSVYPAILYTFNNEVMYKNPYEEAVYKVNVNSKTPVYRFDFGTYDKHKDNPDFKVNVDKKKKVSVDYTNSKEKIAIYRLSETENFLFIYYIHNQANKTGVFDKKKKDFIGISKNGASGMQDDLQRGLPFWPKLGVHKNKMIDYCTAVELKENLNTQKVGIKLREVLKDLDEEDNPVIVIATLK